MRTRAEYKTAVEIVREMLRQWDPYELIAGGAPVDEFDGEARRVVLQIARIRSSADASEVLAEIFGRSFDRQDFSVGKCADAGVMLFDALSRAGLIEPNVTFQQTATRPLN